MMTPLERTLMTISCRDTDGIPKIPGAGSMALRGSERVQIMHNGVEVVFGGYNGDWMAHIIRGLNGHHEPQEELLFHTLMRYVRNGTLMVELGSFWAYYTQWFLKEIPDSKALCIEPIPHKLEIGRRNAELNGTLARTEFLNAWIGGEYLERHQAEWAGDSASAPQFNASSVFAQVHGEAIELLHLDIQGAELPFLRSIDRMAAQDRLRFVLVSTHPARLTGSSTTHSDCLDTLCQLGATILVQHSVEESFSGDGLILASLLREDRDLRFPAISRYRANNSFEGHA